MSNKVYCQDCKFHRDYWGEHLCVHPNSGEKENTALKQIIHYKDIYERNLNNDCKDYKNKGFFK